MNNFFMTRCLWGKVSRFTDTQIIRILKSNEAGSKVSELCSKDGMSQATFYKWRSKFDGIDVSMMKRLKESEPENTRLKRMYSEESLKAELARKVIEKKL